MRQLLEGIDEKGQLKVVAGTYGEWAHKLVAPDSAQGKLLSLGLPALPSDLMHLAGQLFKRLKPLKLQM